MYEWRVIATQDSDLLLAASFSENSYSVAFTILSPDGCPVSASGHEQSCSSEDFPVFSKMYNPYIEGSNEDILKKLKSATLNDNSVVSTFSLSGCAKDEMRTLSLSSPLAKGSKLMFSWKFEGCCMSQDRYCEVFVKPLFKFATLLNEQKALLQKNIQKKDREIEEHRANGSVIKRGHLETKLFDEDLFYKDSLKSTTVVAAIKNPAVHLLSNSRVVQSIHWVQKNMEDIEPSSSASSSPTKSPTKRKTTVHVSELLTTTAKEEPEKDDDADELIEQQRRAKIQKITKQAHNKKKKTKSVF